MCLVVLAFDALADVPLLVAANRDEFHARPTRNADWWSDHPAIVGGRDLQAGGTWLGVHRSGRFATVTNFRGAQARSSGLRSRGHLVSDFLQSDLTPLEYLRGIEPDHYAGFNLLVADASSLAYLSNRGGGIRELQSGIYGLSNDTLDAPSEKVERSKARLAELLDQERTNTTRLMALLGDREKSSVDSVRPGQLPFATAHALTAPFIVTPDYGTRCSTVVRSDGGNRWEFVERRFDAAGNNAGESSFSFRAGADAD